MVINKLELLAPAGTKDAFYAAINSGADAVYVGGKYFSARQSSNNFDNDELVEIVKYAHNKCAKVYVAVNTILKDTEIINALNYAYFLYEADVDAIIVQDIGLIYLINRYLPDFKINISTQATIYDKYGVEFFDYNNIDKYILSRELSLDEIEEISKHTEKNIETFIHGALCMSYSGQCYFSSFLGGRSGNRGKCAQTCRLNYSFIDGKSKKRLDKYRGKPLLSLKDYKAGFLIRNLVKAGVSTFKIEGRMKSPEYDAVVVEYYRHILDNEKNGIDGKLKLLEHNVGSVFNRGFTSGYLKKENETMFAGISTGSFGKDIEEIIQAVKERYSPFSELRRNYVDFYVDVAIGKKIILIAKSGEIEVSVYSEEVVEYSINNPVNDIMVIEQLNKLGNTIYKLGKVTINIQDGSFVKKSTINQLRREALDMIYAKKANFYGRNSVSKVDKETLYTCKEKKECKAKISLKINNKDDLNNIDIRKIGRIYVPLDFDYNSINKLRDVEKYLYIPNVVSEEMYLKIKSNINNIEEIFDGVCVNNVGSYCFFKDNSALKIHCGYFFNIINSYSAIALKEKGASGITFSVESNINDIESISKYSDIDTEVYAHGNIQLMTMKNCPFSVLKGCNSVGACVKCEFSNGYKLRDRINAEFNVIRRNGYSLLYNCVPLSIIGRTSDFMNCNIKFYYVDTLFIDNISDYIDALYMELNGNRINVDKILKQNEFTRGHYFKNIL